MRVTHHLHRIAAILAFAALVLATPFNAECWITDAVPATHRATHCHHHHGPPADTTKSCCHHDTFVVKLQVQTVMTLPVTLMPQSPAIGYEPDSQAYRDTAEPDPPPLHRLILRI
jgi:hypothetical protein